MRKKIQNKKILAVLLIVLFVVLVTDVAVSADPNSKGNYHKTNKYITYDLSPCSYHFITPPPPDPSSPSGCGHWGLTPYHPIFYDDICWGGNQKVIIRDTSDLGAGIAGSLELPHNYVITIYESKNYQGKARTFYFTTHFHEDFYGGSIKIRKLPPLEEQDNNAGKFGNVISPKEIDEILNAHNKYRNEVGAPPLIWSEDLAADAKSWANNLNTNIHQLQHSKLGHGENLLLGGWFLDRRDRLFCL